MKKKRMKRLMLVSRLLFIVYLFFVVYFVLLAEGFGRTVVSEEYRFNLTLFKEIGRFWAYREQLGLSVFFINLFGNVICFIPFGLLMPIIYKAFRNFIVVTLLTFSFSLTIEVIQLFYRIGSFDVDDLLLNTIGGVIGYVIYLIGETLYRKRGQNEK